MREIKEGKEVNTMKYQTPELTALAPAINAVQSTSDKSEQNHLETPFIRETVAAYQDWE